MKKEHAYSSNVRWLLNPWVDTLLLAGFPVFFIVLYLLHKFSVNYPNMYANLWSGNASLYIGHSHFILTGAIIYLDRKEWARKPVHFVWIPLLLTIIFIVLLSGPYSTLTISALYCLIIWHIAWQYYYISKIYRLRNGCNLKKLDSLVTGLAIILGPIYFFLKGFYRDVNYAYFGKKITVPPISPAILQGLEILLWIVLLIFIIRQVMLFIKTKVYYIFDILMVLMANLSFYVPLLLIRDADMFISTTFRWHHSVQYIVWGLFYLRNKFKMGVDSVAGFLSYLPQPRRATLFIIFFIMVSIVYTLMAKSSTMLLIKINSNPLIFAPFIIYTPLIIFHLYIDLFFWDTKKINRIVNN